MKGHHQCGPAQTPGSGMESMSNSVSTPSPGQATSAFKKLIVLAAKMVLGDEIPASLWPILIITLMSTTAFTGVWSYAGVWAITSVHASSSAVGIMFLSYALLCGVTGYLGGRLSDRLGRKRVMITGWTVASVLILSLPLTVGGQWAELGRAVLAMAAGAPATAASNTVVADLANPNERESAYASTRVMFNLGSVLGPPFAGLLLLTHDWFLLFSVAGVLGLVTVSLVLWLLPRTSPNVRTPERLPNQSRRTILHDRPFVLLLVSTLLGYFIYVTYSSVLPVVAVSSYHLAPSAWGFIYAINPIVVVLVQMRITRLTKKVGSVTKLSAASILMGGSFLILLPLPNATGVITLTCVFVVGELLWAPVSQGLVARMAPDGLRGRYMGAFRGAGQVAMGLAPFVVLRMYNLGNTWSWLFVGFVSVMAAVAGGVAAARAPRSSKATAPPAS